MKILWQTLAALRYHRRSTIWLFAFFCLQSVVLIIGLLGLELQITASDQFSGKLSELGHVSKLKPLTTIKAGYKSTIHLLQYGHFFMMALFFVLGLVICSKVLKKRTKEFTPYLTSRFGYRQAAAVFTSQFAIVYTAAYIFGVLAVTLLQDGLLLSLSSVFRIKRQDAANALQLIQNSLSAEMPTKLLNFAPMNIFQSQLFPSGMLNLPMVLLQYIASGVLLIIGVYLLTTRFLRRLGAIH